MNRHGPITFRVVVEHEVFDHPKKTNRVPGGVDSGIRLLCFEFFENRLGTLSLDANQIGIQQCPPI
jgi:hypothetical protein